MTPEISLCSCSQSLKYMTFQLFPGVNRRQDAVIFSTDQLVEEATSCSARRWLLTSGHSSDPLNCTPLCHSVAFLPALWLAELLYKYFRVKSYCAVGL